MSQIEILRYTPQFHEALIRLQQRLWSTSIEGNRRYFQWKFVDNPNAEFGDIFVAVASGELVGARGFMGTLWLDPDGNTIRVPLAGDTVVAKEFEGHYLINRLTEAARLSFARRGIDFMINTSASRATYFHSMRGGWQQVGCYETIKRRATASRFQTWTRRFQRLVPYSRRALGDPFAARAGAHWQGAGGLTALLTNRPDAELLSSIWAQRTRARKYEMVRDASFFSWRFANPMLKYYFLRCDLDGKPLAYLVLRLERRNGRKNIRLIDWCWLEWSAFEFLLQVLADRFPGLEFTALSASFSERERLRLAALGYAAATEGSSRKKYRPGVIAISCSNKARSVSNNADRVSELSDRGFGILDFKGIESDGA